MDAVELQSTGYIELQKLGVVLHTVFLESRDALNSHVQRISPKVTNHDQPGSVPFEDLRKRLTTINGSNSSLNSLNFARHRLTGGLSQRPPSPVAEDLPSSMPLRSSSPSESTLSTSNSVSFRPRLSVNHLEGVKAAPAVGSVQAIAVGKLETPGRSTSFEQGEQSGWASPSFTNTVRYVHSIRPLGHEGLHALFNLTIV